MGYAQKVLQPGEAIKFSGRLHWMIYLRAALFAVGVCVFSISTQVSYALPLLAVSLILLLISIIALFQTWIRRITTEIVVTDKRVIYKCGLISRYTEEMNISKVESVDVSQTVLGRVFSYGTVRIKGVGGSCSVAKAKAVWADFAERLSADPRAPADFEFGPVEPDEVVIYHNLTKVERLHLDAQNL